MDPVSALLTNYLLSISNNIQESYRTNLDLEVTPVSIQYKKMNIGFQHQVWKIKEDSVCITYKQNSSEYSKCTINAKSLFKEICQELSQLKQSNSLMNKHQTMYCNAAVNYQPMIATITSKSNSRVSKNEKECNLLILQSMTNGSQKLKNKRDEVCKKTAK